MLSELGLTTASRQPPPTSLTATAGQDFAVQHGGAGVAAGATEGVARVEGGADFWVVGATAVVDPDLVEAALVGGAPPVDTGPDDTALEDTAPDDTGPDDTALEDTAPEDTGSDEDVPADTVGAPVADVSATEDGGAFVATADDGAGEVMTEDAGTETGPETGPETGAGTAVGIPAVGDEQPASTRANAAAADTRTDERRPDMSNDLPASSITCFARRAQQTRSGPPGQLLR